ncbi:hypothetical protein VNI00_017881 [Paramarasmius palmivorus]|uniref:Uncharacterized protein n=1 Tax=Paramarasmius palmivorus TaxID=297713 RepID=A0AAW0B2D5_9AGAR
MELRLWICSLVALASAVKAFKITSVNSKLPSVLSGNVELTITWERESDDEKKGQIAFVLHLASERYPWKGNTVGGPPLTPTSQSPSKVTFNKMAAGRIGYSQDGIEIKGPNDTTPPGGTQALASTDQQVRQQTTSTTPNDGTPPTTGTSTLTPTTSLATTETVNIKQTDTDTGATGGRTFSPAISFTSSYTTSPSAQNSRGSSQSPPPPPHSIAALSLVATVYLVLMSTGSLWRAPPGALIPPTPPQ